MTLRNGKNGIGIDLKGVKPFKSIGWIGICLLFYSAGCSIDSSELDSSQKTASLDPGPTVGDDQPAGIASQNAAARTVWVVMKQKPSLSAAAEVKGWEAKGQSVYNTLKQNAASSQASIKKALKAKGIAYKSFWIVNALKITADEATITEISKRSDVEKVLADSTMQIPTPQPSLSHPEDVDWNLTVIRAPESWTDFGVRGEGIVVATIDTGVQYDHPALVTQYRGTLPDGAFDHNYNWFDPSKICGDPSEAPCDNAGHGTHTMGSIAGDDGGENQIGVAPGVKWITAKGCEDYSCSTEALVRSGEWMMAPTDLNGENPRVDLRPNIVSNSWGGGSGDEFYRDIVKAWVAAGIFPVFANGNDGYYGCETSNSPGDFPESYSAGSFNEYGNISDFSSRGPSYFDELIKPNISAPGEQVRSSVPGDGYDWNSGTSMATPHVAGAVALLWSAAPAIIGDIETTRALLDDSATDREDTSCGGDASNNNVWGQGQLDTYAALSIAPIGPTGSLDGTVTDIGATPIAQAAVEVTGQSNRHTATNDQGDYHLLLPIGDYQVKVSSFGYITQTADVPIAQDVVTDMDFQLEKAPMYIVEGTVTDSDGDAVAGAVVKILSTPLPETTTDESGYFVFPEVPAGEYSLSIDGGGCLDTLTETINANSDLNLSIELKVKYDDYGYRCASTEYEYIPGDTPVGFSWGYEEQASVDLPFLFPYYGAAYDKVNVTTAGFLSFASSYPTGYNDMIPSPDPPNAAIYAMWDYLYVYYDSSVYTATIGSPPNQRFVVEWRDIIFENDWSIGTFEIILDEMGGISMEYVSVDESPYTQGSSATIGIEDASGSTGLQYSYNKASVRSETAVRYEVPFAGIVQGLVTDANDGAPVAGVSVAAVNGEKTVEGKTSSDGEYRMLLTEGNWTLTVSKKNYTEASASVTVVEDMTVLQDFVLKTAKGVVTPTTLQLVLPQNVVRTYKVTLTNEGSEELTYETKESGGSLQPAAIASIAAEARNPMADANAQTTRDLYVQDLKTASITPQETGDVIKSFSPAGVGGAWGIGQVNDLWISDYNDSTNHEFTVDGSPTGLEFAAPFGEWPGDMAYDESLGMMCQVAVGGDNGIYCWDPASGDVSVSMSASPWNGTSQRGLAYRASDDTFYIGGWNEGIIYHIAGFGAENPGELISSCTPSDPDISGLAYNGAMDVLWMATNSSDDTIYEINPEDCTVISTLAFPESGGYKGAGLEMDPEGNLWLISQDPGTAYLIESGVPAFGDIPWLTILPEEGTVGLGESLELTVTIDTTGLTAGLYLGAMYLQTNSGKQATIRIPVSLVVSAYYQAVDSGGTKDYVDVNGDTWVKDRAYKAGGWGYVQKGKTRSVTKKISGTLDPKLYQTQRESFYAYRYDNVPNGVYQIDLQFAELETVRIGARLFDVIIEDTTVLPAHDIQYEVGKLAADDNRFFIEVTDGRLDVRFIARSGSKAPVVNAVRAIHRPDR